jgi:PAS domain-containing protein
MASSPQPGGKAGTPKIRRKRSRLLYEHRISLYSLLVALPGIVVSGILIWRQPWSVDAKLALLIVELFVWWLLSLALHEQIIRPLQTLANVVAALREEDYSFRARGAIQEDALGELSLEVNALADLLADRRIRAIEATALLRQVVEEIDGPLFAFDPNRVLRLVNPAGEKLLQQAAVRLLGRNGRRNRLSRLPQRSQRITRGIAGQHFQRPLVGAAKQIPRERCTTHSGRLVRRKPRPPRRRAQRVATPNPGARARTQQLTGPDQIDRRQPGQPPRRDSTHSRPAP